MPITRGTPVQHRKGLTAVDKLAVPTLATTADITTNGLLAASSSFKVAVAPYNRWGPTVPSNILTQATAADGNATHFVRTTIPQVAGADGYDLFLSTDAAPKYVGRITEAQRAAGCRIMAMGGPGVGENAGDIAGLIRTALAADPDVGGFFTISGSTTSIVATAKTKAADDATLNIDLENGTAAGLTAAATSANTTGGVAPVLQVETATAVGTITGAGNLTATVTAAGMSNSPKVVTFAVALNDTAAQWAAKARTALAADTDVSSFFTVSGTTTAIVLTALAAAANDATMNIALAATTATDASLPAATSANTTAGNAGTAQVETATAAGNISKAGNLAVIVTAAGMTNSPKTVNVAVTGTAGAAGTVDIGAAGTGAATTAAPFTINSAYTPGMLDQPVDVSGHEYAFVNVKVTPGDLRSAPTLTIVYFLRGSSGDYFFAGSQAVSLLGALLQPLEQTFKVDVAGATGLFVCVDTISGTGTTVDITVEPAA